GGPAPIRRARRRQAGRRALHEGNSPARSQRPAERHRIRRRQAEGRGDRGVLARAHRQDRGADGRGGDRMKVRLVDVAHARSGDKGDTANVGVIALKREWYPLLVRELTERRVAAHFRGAITGNVKRYELPNLGALNFLLHGALDGGGTLSLKTDAQGKVFSTALLRMILDVPDAEARSLG